VRIVYIHEQVGRMIKHYRLLVILTSYLSCITRNCWLQNMLWFNSLCHLFLFIDFIINIYICLFIDFYLIIYLSLFILS